MASEGGPASLPLTTRGGRPQTLRSVVSFSSFSVVPGRFVLAKFLSETTCYDAMFDSGKVRFPQPWRAADRGRPVR